MNRIAELRKSHGISQFELAKRLGIAQNTLSQYENEVRRPTSFVIMNIAKVFDVTTNCVLGLPDPKEVTIDNQQFSLTNVTKIEELESIQQVNLYLSLGWRLLHVGTDATHRDDGTGYSTTVYTLGWYGDPKDTIQLHPADDGDEGVRYIDGPYEDDGLDL